MRFVAIAADRLARATLGTYSVRFVARAARPAEIATFGTLAAPPSRSSSTDRPLILDREAIQRPRRVRLDRPTMPKPEKRPTPPDHRVYPRGSTAPAPKPEADKRGTWTRSVPPDRTFPRS